MKCKLQPKFEQTFDSKGREIVKFLIPLNGSFPPPFDPPDGMKYDEDAYNDYESGIAALTFKNHPLSQSTSSQSPCTGMGFLLYKAEMAGHQVDDDIYIGVATQEQRQNYPNDPTHWESVLTWEASAIEPNTTYWCGYYFLDPSYYIHEDNLYAMVLGMQTLDSLAVYGWCSSGNAGTVYPGGAAYFWNGTAWEYFYHNDNPQDYAFFFCTIIGGCTNPLGDNGQIYTCGVGYGGQPDPTHKYKCINGTWVDQGYNPDCDIPDDCSNPSGTHGQTECGAGYGAQPDPTHKYRCINGTWVDQGYDSDCDTGGCSNPAGAENSEICGDSQYGQDTTHKYKCINGIWEDQGESPDCIGEIDYLPYIIIGAGGILLLIALLSKGK